MKSSIKLIVVSLISVFFGCEKTELNNQESNKPLNRIAVVDPNTAIYGNIKAWQINNGISNNCVKNILVFPSWTNYNQTIDYLDQQTESYCDAFDLQWGYLSDDLYEAKCNELGFDEDKKLLQFENNFTFCSLRKKINALETAWLAIQGDGLWDANADPDNHFIEDDIERALLNEGVEVIIGPFGTKQTSYILYKKNPNGTYYEISLTTTSPTNNTIINNDALIALQEINNGTYVAGSNSSVVLVIPVKPLFPCRESNSFAQYYPTGSNTKIKAKDKYGHVTLISDPKVVAKTKSYKKRNTGGWKLYRSTITAKLTTISGIQCGSGLIPLPKEHTDRRKKVGVKWNGYDLQSLNPAIIDNSTFGIHKRESVIFNVDLYDGQAQ